MDIVVAVPKSEYENFAKEVEEIKQDPELQKVWTLSRIPKELKLGSRMYFVYDGRVAYSVRVTNIKKDSAIKCETTGRTWGGRCQVFGDDLREEQGPEMRGFQGFRYRRW
ncbi:hypothetical protein [Aneurinibacillus migulanus]|uniref:Uncharacterized protein n=1 Tax=Aneurinibacillus migulanus TaxID=47500 RepID=A0A0D1YNT7_ANEMI|nr:hypothetical protein [Aneurinibacillus migulanus]KIV60302.1 hypothetical protein TS65_00515 [Aneurinibacillus migulanus]KON90500.1 hypothetical protein AF333_28890 [Aneurinibacillus migulanus]MED0894922.1 hypothetical protein [Aneurinibacillus migulanus]MED1614435.1 hypothetical protein [Aneurinibacillus migulanus]SDJ77785.1 hypothetical protein SAMN04487909_12853 [Aneurinibacillus migulanus]